MAARLAFAALLIAVASAAVAQPPEEKRVPFITRDSLELAARSTLRDEAIFHVDVGAVDLNTRLGRLRFNYLPFLAALPYAFGSKNWNQIPNAFVLTGTDIAHRWIAPKEPNPDDLIR